MPILDQSTQKPDVDPALIGMPYLEPDQWNSDVYISLGQNTLYNDFSRLEESIDAYGNYVCSFYSQKNFGLHKVAEVLNADRNSCRVLTVDELEGNPGSAPSTWPEGWTGSAEISDDFARSGEWSFDMMGKTLMLNLLNVKDATDYELSFWMRDPTDLQINGSSQNIPAYDKPGHEWQRVVMPISQITGDHTVSINISATAGHIDDIRFAPVDAQVYTMTNSKNGWVTSMANGNDVISFFYYDDFGKLTEIRDFQGLLVSTQVMHEGKR